METSVPTIKLRMAGYGADSRASGRGTFCLQFQIRSNSRFKTPGEHVAFTIEDPGRSRVPQRH
jgi:hypothetical protein